MKKKLLSILILCLAVIVCAVGLIACDKKDDKAEDTECYLDMYPLDDGTFGVKIGRMFYAKEVVIPETYNGKPVTKILDYFSTYGGSIHGEYNEYLESITIPDSVTSIGDDAFYYCSSLTSVTIGNSVTSIGDDAFLNCSSLTSITIPDSVTSIGEDAFENCISLTSITIGNGVINSIGHSAFSGCYKLVEVINKSGLNIEKGSYSYGHVGIYALNVKTSGESDIVNKNGYLFYTYESINYLLGYIGNETVLILPDNYNGENYEIYKYAFLNCSSLTSITIPDSVTSIGDSAFRYCSSLASITFADTTTWYRISDSTGWKNKTGGKLMDVTNPSENASDFKNNYSYYWYKI